MPTVAYEGKSLVIDANTINHWFTYHPPTKDQTVIYETLRAHAREFAHIINNLVPDGADKMDAMRKLREVVMTANAGVATASPQTDGAVAPPTPPVAPARRADAHSQTSVWPTPADTAGLRPVPKSTVPDSGRNDGVWTVATSGTSRRPAVPTVDDLARDYLNKL